MRLQNLAPIDPICCLKDTKMEGENHFGYLQLNIVLKQLLRMAGERPHLFLHFVTVVPLP